MVVATFKEGVTQEEIRALIPAYRATLLFYLLLSVINFLPDDSA